MIRNLKGKLAALSNAQPKAGEKTQFTACMIRDTAAPLIDYPGFLSVCAQDLARMGEAAQGFDIRRTLFLDTETTGLMGGAGTVAFLVGLGWVEGDAFLVRQLLMRDYPEEPFLLAELTDLLPRFDRVVTFNGKSFDLPLLRSRLTMARMRASVCDLAHVDLIHHARRVFRMRLHDCRLSNLEEKVLGLAREDDLPGALVPERYFAFLKCKDMAVLEDVLRHNLQDIRTLAVLLAKLCEMHRVPEQAMFPEDVLGIGRSLERAGDRVAARRCYRVASVGALSTQAKMRLASSYRKDRDMAAAAEVYRDMALRGEGGAMPYEALAMIAERYEKNVAQALWYTERALLTLAGPYLPGKGPDPYLKEALARRQARLIKRAQRIRGAQES